MGRWSREELEDAFDRYQEVALAAAKSGDWRPWADLFTEDCTYKEHSFGTFCGREAVYRWISETMTVEPGNCFDPANFARTIERWMKHKAKLEARSNGA